MFLKKFRHIKYQLLYYNILLLLLTVIVVLMANSEIRYSLESYGEYSQRYEELNLFYESVSQADAAAKSYLYANTEETKKYYENQKEMAEGMLDRLSTKAVSDEMDRQYQNLEKMLQTHSELFQMINHRERMGDLSLAETYDFFIGIADNIADSYQNCSTMLSNEMKERDVQMQKTWEKQIILISLLIGGMVLGMIFFCVAGIRNIIHPIGDIVKNIERIKEGQYQLKPVKCRSVELEVLEQAVEDMAYEVKMNLKHIEEKANLEKKILEKENENLKVNELLTQTEIKALQQQINPHFLFNTLSMISKMAYLEQAMKTSHLMEITADVLRYGLDKANGTSDLFGEIECTRNYLEIQKLRYGGRILFLLQVEEDLPNTVMPGMVVQPFIENAVIHGVRDLTEHAQISISFGKDEDHVFIRVEDNGIGMDGETLQQLLTGKESIVKENQRKSIGVWNVCKRLEMFYGKKGMVQIESDPDCGTAVSIAIPYGKEADVDEAFDHRR